MKGLSSGNKVGRTGQDLSQSLVGPKNAPRATNSLSRKKILSCVRADEHAISRRRDVTHRESMTKGFLHGCLQFKTHRLRCVTQIMKLACSSAAK